MELKNSDLENLDFSKLHKKEKTETTTQEIESLVSHMYNKKLHIEVDRREKGDKQNK